MPTIEGAAGVTRDATTHEVRSVIVLVAVLTTGLVSLRHVATAKPWALHGREKRFVFRAFGEGTQGFHPCKGNSSLLSRPSSSEFLQGSLIRFS